MQEALLERRVDPSVNNHNLTTLLKDVEGYDLRVTDNSVLTGGCWNRVLGAVLEDGRKIVFKISPNPSDPRILREFRVLRSFAEVTSMPIPEPLFVDESRSIVDGTVLGMTMIEGCVMHECYGMMPIAARSAVSKQIGRQVAELHRHTARGFGGVELESGERHDEWAEFWLPRFDAVFRDIRTGSCLRKESVDEIEAMRPDFESVLRVERATFTHYDIWSGNVMIEPGRSTVTGYIDIPGFYADYARELSFMMMFGVADEAFFEEYLAMHTLDPTFELRVNLYNLKMHLKHITMYPTQSYYRDGAKACAAFLRSRL